MANIKEKVEHIRKSQYGREVREAIASGIEAINQETESTTVLATQKVADMNTLQNDLTTSELQRVSNENDREQYIQELDAKIKAGYLKGDKGDKGEKGDKGDTGSIANVKASDVSTTTTGSNVQVILDGLKQQITNLTSEIITFYPIGTQYAYCLKHQNGYCEMWGTITYDANQDLVVLVLPFPLITGGNVQALAQYNFENTVFVVGNIISPTKVSIYRTGYRNSITKSQDVYWRVCGFWK